jgi:DNA-binding XRE family transcriptional regulator/AraC-like DNA-binding protein
VTGLESSDEGISEEEVKWQNWVSLQLERLFSAAPNMSASPSKLNVCKSIVALINRLADGRSTLMAQLIDLPRDRINNWRAGKRIPRFNTIMKISYLTNTPVIDIFTGEVISNDTKELLPELAVNIGKRKGSVHRRPIPLDLSSTKQRLETLLDEGFTPRSLKDISQHLDRSSSTLRYQFPDICKSIVHRYKEYQQSLREGFHRKIEDSLNAALIAEPVAPTLEDLVRKFKCHRSVFLTNFPVTCTKLKKRNGEDQKRKWGKIKNTLLYALKDEEPPPSFRAVRRRAGYSEQTLRNKFPEICIQISKRHAQHRKNEFLAKRKELAQQVKTIAYTLYSQGVYPSVRAIQSQISTLNIRSNRTALAALREVRHELD